jgi:hypothetical protein
LGRRERTCRRHRPAAARTGCCPGSKLGRPLRRAAPSGCASSPPSARLSAEVAPGRGPRPSDAPEAILTPPSAPTPFSAVRSHHPFGLALRRGLKSTQVARRFKWGCDVGWFGRRERAVP